jgi:diguanylate cyclase (GGDEF)-like protein/PAS domain S-box-containing protein
MEGCGHEPAASRWLASAALLQPALYLRLDVRGWITDAAGDTGAILGLERDEIVGGAFTDFASPECRETLVEWVACAASVEPGLAADVGRFMAIPGRGSWQLGSDGTGGAVASCVTEAAPRAMVEKETLLRLADAIPVLIAYVDRDLRYRFVNLAYEKFFHCRRESLRGRGVSEIVSASSLERLLPLYRRTLTGEHVAYSDRVELRDGRSLDLQIDYLPDRDDRGSVAGFFALIQDVTLYGTTIDLLKTVHGIVNRTVDPTDETLEQLLRVGLEHLQLSIALVARVEDDRYIVEAAVSRKDAPAAGEEFPLGNTYCSITLAAEDVVATSEAGGDERVAGHPCYREFGLESYIGVPVRIDGEVWGTVNFSAPEARADPFSALEYELVRLIGDAVAHLVHERIEHERQERERQRLKTLAYRDALTGLANRKSLDRKLHELIQEGRPYQAAVVDLDHFKGINDRWGHDGGDTVLRAVAEIIRKTMRPSDVIARYGGEEFVIIMEDTGDQNGANALERLRQAISDHPVRVGEEQFIQVTASIGVTGSQPEDAPGQAFSRADRALYKAKASGRNMVLTG